MEQKIINKYYKTMKKLMLSIVVFVALTQFSCVNNSDKTGADLTKHKEDSARRADSINQENIAREGRLQYQARIQQEIDSIEAMEQERDMVYENRSDKEQQTYMEHRNRINTSIERLKKKKESIGAIAKDDWARFKIETDTAMTNLKNDWNEMLDKMKAK